MHTPSRLQPRSRLVSASLVLALLSALPSAFAATQYWDPSLTPTANSGTGSGGNGTWLTATANWSSGTADAALTATNIADFAGASGTVALSSAVSAAGLQFDTSGYTIGSGSTSAQIAIASQTTDTSGIVVGSGVTGTVINVGSIKLGSSASAVSVLLSNTDQIDFKSTTVYLSGSRTTKISNSSAGATTTLAKFAVSDKPSPTGGTWPNAQIQLNQGGLTINSLAGASSANGTLATFGNATASPFVTTFNGNTTGVLTINGNNTLYANGSATQVAPLTLAFAMPSGTLALGNDNALGARNGSGALTGNILQMSSGTLTSAGGARVLENLMTVSGSFTIGGSSSFTIAGNVTQSGGSRTLTISNSGGTVFSGPVFLSESSTLARTLTIAGGGNLTISGPISNFNGSGLAGNLTKNGTGTLTLSSATSSFNGTTTISGGTLAVGANNGLSANSALSLGNGTLDLKTFSATVPSLLLTDPGAKVAFDLTGRSINNSAAFLTLSAGFNEGSDLSGYTVDFGGFTASSAGSYKLIGFTSFTSTLLGSDFTIANLNTTGLSASLVMGSNDLSLVLTSAIPEPSSFAALAGVAGLGVAALRRRRR